MNSWFELPSLTGEELRSAETVEGRLSGDPATLHDLPMTLGFIYNNIDMKDDSERKKIKEETRIAALITIINRDAQIVPRKAYYRDSSMQIKPNPSFEGLTPDEISLGSSYLHFRNDFQLTSRTLSDRMNTFDESIDIFQSIDRDVPNGIEILIRFMVNSNRK